MRTCRRRGAAGGGAGERPGSPVPSRRRWLGLGAGLLAILLPLGPVGRPPRAWAADAEAPPAKSPAPASPFSDPEVIARRFAEACDAVEKACGTPFRRRPTWALSSRAAVREVLRGELEPRLARLGMEEHAGATIEAHLRALLAKYEPGAHRVHLLEGGAARVASAAGLPAPGEDELRVLLAHEVTHALDWERFPLVAQDEAATTQEQMRVFAALAEGHAQWVARQVASAWGIEGAFDRFTARITTVPPIEDALVRRTVETLVAESAFGYVQGLAFMQAVAAARGREGVDAVMRSPPTSSRAIERPEEWLAGGTADREPDLDAALDRVRPLVGDPAWKVQATRLTDAILRAQAQAVPAEDRAEFLTGYVDGRILVAAVPTEGRQVIAMLLWWKTPEDAQRFARTETATARDTSDLPQALKVSGTVEDRAGRDGKFPGHTVKRRIQAGDESIPVEGDLAVMGRLVVETVLVKAPEIGLAVRADLLDRLEAFLRDPAAEAAKPPSTPVALESAQRDVEVEVLDPDGKPVPRARVRFTGDASLGTTAARQGRAKVRVQGEGTIAVWAAADDRGVRLPLGPVDDVPVAADATRVTVRLTPGLSIRGRAVGEDGAPAAGLTVQAEEGSGDESGDFAAEGWDEGVDGTTTTAEDGTFTLVGLGERVYRLRLVHEDEVVVDALPRVAGGATEVTLRRGSPSRLEVRVVDVEGRPVPGARCSAWASIPSGKTWMLPPTTTGADGRAVLRPMGRDATFSVLVGPPEAREDLAQATLEGAPGKPVTVTLGPGRTIRGSVVGADGAPTRAVVRAKAAPARAGRDRVLDEPGVPTDAEGGFVFRGLPAGDAELVAVPADLSPWDTASGPWTRVPADRSTVRLVVPEGAVLEIVVTGPDARPVASALVAISAGHATTTFPLAEGTGHAGMPKGPFGVAVARARAADGIALGAARRELPAGTRRVEFRLEPSAALRGTVLAPDGTGVAGAVVVAGVREGPADAPADRALAALAREGLARARTGPDGTFVIEGLGREEYVLSVRPPEGFVAVADHVARGGETTEIRLTAGREPRVTVVDEHGAPVPFARVLVTRTTTRGRSVHVTEDGEETTADRRGVARVPPPAPADRHGLVVSPPVGRDDLLGETVTAWDRNDLSVTLRPTRRVHGRVVDSAGQPVAGAVVRPETERAPRVRSGAWEATTDADGRFALSGVPRDGLVLSARLPGRHGRPEEPSRPRRVAPEEDDVVITLARRTTLRLRVDARAGRVVRVVVRRDGDERVLSPAVGPGGICEVPDVPPGDVSVYVPDAPDDDRCGWLPSVDRAAEVVEVPLAKGLAIRIRLKVPPRTRLESLDVLGPAGPMRAEPASPEEEGLWIVRGLPPGRWTVKARARSPDAWIRATVEAEAGSEVVVEPR